MFQIVVNNFVYLFFKSIKMKTKIYIQNLKCGGCANTILKNMASIEGINNVEVELSENALSFGYENETNLNEVKHKLITLGYPEIGETNNLSAKAKSFVSCAVGKLS